MAKVTQMAGIAKGKVGGIVYSVRNGQQIARQYQPYVSNPSTTGQVKVRAKLKLLSQVSANMSGVIAIPREGTITPRNQFTQVNYKNAKYNNNAASMKLADMQLTKSAVALEGFRVDRSDGTKLHVELTADQSNAFSRIIYVVVKILSTGKMVPVFNHVVQDAGQDGTFPCDLPYIDTDISVHAYGIRDLSAAAAAAFGAAAADGATGIASVIADRKVKVEDMQISETRGLYLTAAQTTGETTGDTRSLVTVQCVNTAGAVVSGFGSVSGAGRYEDGEFATLVASPAEGYEFKGWRESPTGAIFAQNPNFTYQVNGDRVLYAVFALIGVEHDVTTSFYGASVNTGAALSGGGSYATGDSVTVVAPAAPADTVFVGWYDARTGGTKVSSSLSYTFQMPANNITLYAYYEASGNEG